MKPEGQFQPLCNLVPNHTDKMGLLTFKPRDRPIPDASNKNLGGLNVSLSFDWKPFEFCAPSTSELIRVDNKNLTTT